MFGDTATCKALEAGLIGRGRRDIGPGDKIVEVYRMDEVRALDQGLRGPERILEIRAAPFELGRQCTVQNNQWTSCEETVYWVTHDCSRRARITIILRRAFARGLVRTACSPLRPLRISTRIFSPFCTGTWKSGQASATYRKRPYWAVWSM